MIRALVIAAFFAACGPGPTTPPKTPCHELAFKSSGMPQNPVMATLESNVFRLPLRVGQSSGFALLDTGAPISILDPAAFPRETLPAGSGNAPTVTFGDVVIDAPKIVGGATGVTLGAQTVTALIGGELLCHFDTTFDYREPRVFFADTALPTDVAAPIDVPLTVEGGGTGTFTLNGTPVSVTFPPTRLMVKGVLDGVERRFVVDTGASFTILSKAAFDALIADGRKSVTIGTAATFMGMVGVPVARARSLKIGGAEVTNSIVGSVDSTIFSGLATEVGGPVDGLLGASWLREFLTTTDYDDARLRLRPYPMRSHISDEFIRTGITLRTGGLNYAVDVVFPGSDAATKGFVPGLEVLSVDGVVLRTLSVDAADRALRGAIGSTKLIVTAAGTANVAVEDVLK